MQKSGITPQTLSFQGERFFDWLVRPNDQAVFEGLALPATAPGTTLTSTPLNVRFDQKDQAKALGALWQPDQKRWVVPAGRDLAPFKAWLE
jgi:hypothetical protein